ncbi:MAG: glutamate 5-kinase, partial [Oscillibacter sp.]
GGAGTWRGTGGMATKLAAANIAMGAGCDMVITNGQRTEDLYDIVAGKDVGTRFIASK